MEKARDAANRLCKVHGPDTDVHILKPGEAIRIGRHRGNDLVLTDPQVSRFHARINWDLEVERPVVFDNSSQNGVLVDNRFIDAAESLYDGAEVTIGPFKLKIELSGCSRGDALLSSSNDMVALFSEGGPDVTGPLTTEITVVRLMQRLESERRTGTLRLTSPEGEATVTYYLGRVMWVEHPTGKQGVRALEHVLMIGEGTFRFSREIEPRENHMELWISDYLRSRGSSSGDSTQVFRVQ